MQTTGFDWDDGNWPKCGKHGVSRAEIEQVFAGRPFVMTDPFIDEPRWRAIGKTHQGRHVFLVFTLRNTGDAARIRPVCARYMHQKEVDHHERQTQTHTIISKR